MGENLLSTKSINQLLEYSFLIPSYQRGYRWTPVEVTQMLEDIWAFLKNPPVNEPGKKKHSYCLQPVVVRQHGTYPKEMEVIDGQQRLTTIFLILKELKNLIERDQKNFSRIFFETRPGSEIFLRDFNENDPKQVMESEKNVDYYHIAKATTTIHKWFTDKANNSEDAAPRCMFVNVFLTKTEVLWYEANEENVNPIDIFTRINIGKIPLTNSELIKALFMHRDNFDPSSVSLRQIQIASEWDAIERQLREDSFWYFIYNPANPIKYENRIEYIFDLMTGRRKDDEFYYTLNKFQDAFVSHLLENRKPDIDHLWLEIKNYFLRLEEWYKDRVFYHLVGFLIDCNYSIGDLVNVSQGKTKNGFTKFLEKEIASKVTSDFDKLDYKLDRAEIRQVLLLFNIQTILASEQTNNRFPFDRYKGDEWDIEHVRSQTDKNIKPVERKAWALESLGYFTGLKGYSNLAVNGGLTEKELQAEAVNNIDKQDEKALCLRLCKILDMEKIGDNDFMPLYEDIQKHFDETAVPDDIDNIANLALLDSSTNRSYKNAPFPIKRKRIIENDKNGIFVPICTKNLFLKYYSRKIIDIMYWKNTDAEDYLSAIRQTLSKYFTS